MLQAPFGAIRPHTPGHISFGIKSNMGKKNAGVTPLAPPVGLLAQKAFRLQTVPLSKYGWPHLGSVLNLIGSSQATKLGYKEHFPA